MKRIITLFIIYASYASYAYAQESSPLYDSCITEICGFVNTLHHTPDKYEQVFMELSERKYWRLMEEFDENCSPRSSLCSLWDKVEMTGINDRAFQAEQKRGSIPQSTDNFCTGNEASYSYSFFESRILPGKSIRSHVSQRTGPQLFVIMPYNPGCISATVSIGEREYEGYADSNGYILFEIDSYIKPDDVINITITNTSTSNQSAVIINNNTRK
ncbi:MAG: hypothetical protein IKU36_03165 [Bacteroidales bacterium]|nr:hypothetical protein [Bacteroidales bacterium]